MNCPPSDDLQNSDRQILQNRAGGGNDATIHHSSDGPPLLGSILCPCNSNLLTVIPDGLCNLSGLTELNLVRNRLRALPDRYIMSMDVLVDLFESIVTRCDDTHSMVDHYGALNLRCYKEELIHFRRHQLEAARYIVVDGKKSCFS